MFLRWVCLCVLIVPAVAALAGEPVRDHDIVAEDYFTIGVVTDCAVSPDGKYVAYTEMRWQPPDERRNLDLWVVERQGGSATRLTFDKVADTNPQWDPDNRWIYFASSRKQGEGDDPPYNGKTQVWRVSPAGGPIFAVTRLPDGVQDFRLSADGRAMYYVVGDEQVDDEWKDLHGKYKDLELGHGVVEYSQVWKLDLQSWRAEKLIDDKRVIREFVVCDDQTRIAMITTPTAELISNEGRSRVDVFDCGTGEITTVPDKQWRDDAPSPYGWLESLAWTRDGQALAFAVDFDGYPAEIFVVRMGADGPVAHKVARPGNVSVSTAAGMEWRGVSNDLCFVAEDHARGEGVLRTRGCSRSAGGSPDAYPR